MLKVLALLPNSVDNNAMDNISSKMISAFQQANGLRSLNVSEGNIMSPEGPPPYSKVVEATFDSLEDFMAWVQTPAAQADNEQMVNAGIVRIFYEANDL